MLKAAFLGSAWRGQGLCKGLLWERSTRNQDSLLYIGRPSHGSRGSPAARGQPLLPPAPPAWRNYANRKRENRTGCWAALLCSLRVRLGEPAQAAPHLETGAERVALQGRGAWPPMIQGCVQRDPRPRSAVQSSGLLRPMFGTGRGRREGAPQNCLAQSTWSTQTLAAPVPDAKDPFLLPSRVGLSAGRRCVLWARTGQRCWISAKVLPPAPPFVQSVGSSLAKKAQLPRRVAVAGKIAGVLP